MSRLSRTIALPIGPNGQLVTGTLLMNDNGDAEWFAGTGLGQQQTPTFTSNASNDFEWQPSPNCVSGVSCPTTEQRQLFYSSPASQRSLNNARLETWRSPTGYNSPQTAVALNIPGTVNTARTPAPTPDPVNLNQEIADDTRFLRPSYPTNYYPLTLEDNKQDRIKFTMLRYGNRPLTFTGNNINPLSGNVRRNNQNQITQIQGSVYLPIQSGISDSSNVEWGGERLDALTATAASLALAGMKIDAQTNILEQLGNTLEIGKTKLFNAASQGGLEALKLYLAELATSTNGLVSRVTGGVVNPNLELLFAGPQLRPFNFTFKLSPRSQPEATQVRNIIRFFKQGMSVKVASNDIFLKAPNVFNISYESFDPSGNRIINHPSIGQIKTCALTGFDVNYTPDGSYMTFNDNERTMTSYEISMRFSELEPVTERDIYPINENHIGY